MNWSLFRKLLIAGFMTVFTNCEKQNIQSIWTNDIMTIDGKSLEWKQYLTNLHDTTISAAVMNDADFIYICIVSCNENFNRLAGVPGLELLFSHCEMKGETGIRFTSGISNRARPPEHAGFNGDKPERFQPKPIPASLQTIELFNKNGDSTVITSSIAQRYGIQAKIDGMRDTMTCEIMLPLHDNDSSVFSIGIVNDSLMSVTVETAEKKHERGPGNSINRQPPSGGRNGGGFGGGMGPPPGGNGMGGNGGGMMGEPCGGNHPSHEGEGMQMAGQMKMEFEVKLAAKK